MLAQPEYFPEISIGQGSEGRNFKLQKMVLIGVEIDGVDAGWRRECV